MPARAAHPPKRVGRLLPAAYSTFIDLVWSLEEPHYFWLIYSSWTLQSLLHFRNMDTSKEQKTIVVGAGPVGCLAALYAALRGDDVEIYELRGGM